MPAGLALGAVPAENAHWFRVTPRGTILAAAAMLGRRAAHRMHIASSREGTR
jgi:hypothetical protein